MKAWLKSPWGRFVALCLGTLVGVPAAFALMIVF